MMDEDRAQLRHWLSEQLAEFETSGELYGQLADRILAHIWNALEPGIERRIDAAVEAAKDQIHDLYEFDRDR